MLHRYYALTEEKIDYRNKERYEANVWHASEHPRYHKEILRQEVKRSFSSSSTLIIFDNFEAADLYASESATYQHWSMPSGNDVDRPVAQYAIIEFFSKVPLSACQKEEFQIKAQTKPQQLRAAERFEHQPTQPDKVHVLFLYKMKNNPANIIYQVFHPGLDQYDKPNTPLELYKDERTEAINGIKPSFTEYYRPAFFSAHNRHYKFLAEKIDAGLKNETDPTNVKNYLSDMRDALVKVTPNLNMHGTFMSRMKHAIDTATVWSQIDEQINSAKLGMKR